MEEETRRIRVFFYGTFMSPEVLAKHGVAAREVLPAKVSNFEIYIRPRVNLAPSDGSSVYGAVAGVTHDELDKIYSGLEKSFGLKYLPEAVLAETLGGTCAVEAVLCYIAPQMAPGPAAPGYVKELAACVRALNLPESYAVHIESFG